MFYKKMRSNKNDNSFFVFLKKYTKNQRLKYEKKKNIDLNMINHVVDTVETSKGM